MALPLAPIAGLALRYGAVAIAAYAVSRSVALARRDQRGEDALNEVPEGLTARREEGQVNGTVRWRRILRLRHGGPGLEIDATSLGRIRFKKV